MASVPARPPRYGIDPTGDPAAGHTADANSTASHGSSSRFAPAAGTRSTGTPAPAPIALADVLARSNADHVAALDQVLAERNQFCLDNAKLSSENVRIWNLMGRIRKENESLKAKLAELERAHGVAPSAATKASPLNSATGAIPGSPAGNRRRLPYANEGERSSSPLSSPRHARQSSRTDLEQRSAAPAPAHPALGAYRSPPEAVQPSFGSAAATYEENPNGSLANGSGAVYDSPITSVDQGPSRATQPVDTGAERSVSNGPHASIMQQRAAAQAQAQSLSLARPGQGADNLTDSPASHEDFEAIERSSASGTDENPHQIGMTPRTPVQERLRAPHQQAFPSPSGVTASSPYQAQLDPSAEQERSLLASGPNRNRVEVTPTMIPSSASTRSLASRMVTEDRISRGPGSKRSKDDVKKRVLAPRLDSSLLRVASVKIQGTNYRAPDRGKESISFLITVDILHPPASWGLNSMSSGEPTPPTSWTIEKSYSDIVGLDAKLRSKVGKKASQRLAPLPDKALFKDHAPAKVDQRKALLEIYLQSLMVLELPDKDEVCTFLCTDVVPNRIRDPTSCSKEGFLTKKGQNLGRWVTRFYVLRNSYLSYFEARGGAQIGSINIREAQIGRQQKSTAGDQDENAYRHAFLILEKRDASHEEPAHIARHVLCAESDDERDDWVDVLVRAIAELDGNSVDESPASPTQAMSKMSLSHNPSTPGRDGGYNGRLPDATFSPSADVASRPFAHDGGAPMSQDPSRTASARLNSLDSTATTSRQAASTAATSLPQSASYRSFNEPRSPASTRNAELQDPPGSPDLRSDSLGRGKASISGPINGAPIPAGYKFGARDDVAPDSKKDDKKRFWQGFRAFGGHDKQNREPRPVFGVPLAESIAISSIHEGLALPSVVYRCIEYLEKRNAFMEEGIYRLSGSSAVIKTLKDRFNMEGDVDLLAENQYYDPHAIAGLLKTFLRELPTSVLTRELHMDFMRVNELQDRAERINELGELVSQLPLANYSLLRTLCSHLIKIIEHSDVNKMTMRNVGIVFSPTLAIGAGVFALFLTEFDSVFETDANGEPAPKRIEEEVAPADVNDQGFHGDALDNAKRNKRNSVQYRESQADKLLGLEGRSLSHRTVDEDMEGIPDEPVHEGWVENGSAGGDRNDSSRPYEQYSSEAQQQQQQHAIHHDQAAPSAVVS
ncbi:related to BEM3-GTPase-activating protein [Sporisorium reilianum SRZ2]|uniref:Related to BEM3-GTPase-activating protein n=1 Tax=Sporisorium reilianum (strain SRZ2) TaxID=999809 RepID=E6ZT77_SPORE|nr:related to BEM3-GTPase-activating protein [Sporisorium reilianum SRZ2]